MNKTLQKIQTRIDQLEQKMETCHVLRTRHSIRGNYLGDYTVCISQLICHAQSEIDDGEVKESVTRYISVSLYIYIFYMVETRRDSDGSDLRAKNSQHTCEPRTHNTLVSQELATHL